ncbi:hypothetical protein JCM8547_003146 [Rhodosporidiobolus lusitaniae]
MARGLQKIEAQQKSREKLKAKEGGKSNLKTRAEGLKVQCPACKIPVSDMKNLTEHFGAKHPKLPMPTAESLGVSA